MTDIQIALPISAGKERCQVLSMTEYMQRYATTPERNNKVPSHTFLRRQTFNTKTNEIEPVLHPVCYCNKVLNPSEVVVKCKGCGTHLHSQCVAIRKGQKCPVCSQKVEGEAIKRQKPENDIVKQPVKARKVEDEKVHEEQKNTETIYPTISRDRAIALDSLIRRLEHEGQLNFDRGNDSVSNFRAKAKEKFTYALVSQHMINSYMD
jgi:uncharacterized Zn finger protein (UPF0148 family)